MFQLFRRVPKDCFGPPVLLCCLDQEYSSYLEATENKREQGSLLLLQKTWSTTEADTAQWLIPQGKEKSGACVPRSGFSGACLTDWFLSALRTIESWVAAPGQLQCCGQTPERTSSYELLKKEMQISLIENLYAQVQRRHINRKSSRVPLPSGIRNL